MECLDISTLDNLDETGERQFWAKFDYQLTQDDGQAAQEHLAAGRPIFYCLDDISDEMVREWPNGDREIVEFDDDNNITVIRSL